MLLIKVNTFHVNNFNTKIISGKLFHWFGYTNLHTSIVHLSVHLSLHGFDYNAVVQIREFNSIYTCYKRQWSEHSISPLMICSMHVV